jgi:hypothetical protein
MLRLANKGHVRLIADLAAERDKIKRELEKASRKRRRRSNAPLA